MSKTVESGILRGRPFGGVSILINNNIRHLCLSIFCSERYVIIKVANYLIANVYLPCVGTSDRLLICEDILKNISASSSSTSSSSSSVFDFHVLDPDINFSDHLPIVYIIDILV